MQINQGVKPRERGRLKEEGQGQGCVVCGKSHRAARSHASEPSESRGGIMFLIQGREDKGRLTGKVSTEHRRTTNDPKKTIIIITRVKKGKVKGRHEYGYGISIIDRAA